MINRKILALLTLGEAFSSLARLEISRDSGFIKSGEVNDSKNILTGQLGHSLFRKIHFSREFKSLKELNLKVSCLINEDKRLNSNKIGETLHLLLDAEFALSNKYSTFS